jgi:alpha-ketoglutarate-dependent taurine dioxygenase/acyl carrier protein
MATLESDAVEAFTEQQQTLPFVIQANTDTQQFTDFVMAERPWIETQLLSDGALLFRGFQSTGVTDFEKAIQSLWGELLTYQDRATPRQQVAGNVYTSTEYPSSHRIFLHNENSFACSWPTRISFFCAQPAQTGGATPIADIRRVWQRIDPAIRQRFMEKQVMYVRNFGQGFGLPWHTVFNTTDRSDLEAYCQEADIHVEWLDQGQRLRTRQVRPAAVQHPQTGDWAWFNHAAVLNVSTLKPSLRDAFLNEFSREDLPNNTYYGDGSEIESDVLDHIRAAYEAEKRVFSWQAGDMLVLDNLLVAHGREPYTGPRKIWVGMAKPMSWMEVTTQSQGDTETATNRTQQPTALETVLAAIWTAHLDVEAVGIHDNFFELGGQSLEAIDIIDEVKELFQVSLSLRALTLTPTISEFAKSLATTPDETLRLEKISQLTLDMLQSNTQDS